MYFTICIAFVRGLVSRVKTIQSLNDPAVFCKITCVSRACNALLTQTASTARPGERVLKGCSSSYGRAFTRLPRQKGNA